MEKFNEILMGVTVLALVMLLFTISSNVASGTTLIISPGWPTYISVGIISSCLYLIFYPVVSKRGQEDKKYAELYRKKFDIK